MRKMSISLHLLLAACNGPALPGGYTVEQSAMNREWIKGPDGNIVTPGLIQKLYRSENTILVIALAASSGGDPIPPRPLDQGCLVALLIDTKSGRTSQIDIPRATELAGRMEAVVSHDRSCS